MLIQMYLLVSFVFPGGRLRAGAVRPGRPVHELRRHQVPHKVGAARSAQLHQVLIQIWRLGIW